MPESRQFDSLEKAKAAWGEHIERLAAAPEDFRAWIGGSFTAWIDAPGGYYTYAAGQWSREIVAALTA
ncbi:MAG: hypothetical protein ACT4O2_02425 [Beijerinckiaceae bacterium]